MAPFSKQQRQKIILIAATCVLGALIIFTVVFLIIRDQEATNSTQTPGAVSVELGEQEDQKWPILKELPIKNTLYTIGYTITSDQKLKIYVNSTDTNIDAALNKLASLTTEPLSSYDIEVQSPNNPFKEDFAENSNTDPAEFLKAGYANIDFTITNITRSGEAYVVELTTGSTETYDLVHYTAIIQSTDSGLILATKPTFSALLNN